ncbi:S8 family peptidase [Roseateles violae]|uniref:S8 family peptidase n=1 Tax=Roseateles violae TaxID=3058042 RepID=A0ABT8DT76_9BURK|nr:S8 family peptidase [Pelomonas sp. PFR6]MDN3919366.1 S8 family peptidase [Pelomonas sp. PFR6]
MADLDHLLVSGFTQDRPFRSNLSGRSGASPQRNRGPHGNALLRQLELMRLNSEQLSRERRERGFDEAAGMTIAIQFSPAADYDYMLLEWKRDGVEVLSVVDSGAGPVVAVYVPDGKLTALEKRVREYLNEDTKTGKPKNAKLVNSIDGIRRAAFEQLWTEDEPAPVQLDEVRWYQLWIRHGGRIARDVAMDFAAAAEPLQIEVEPGYVNFPGRVVLAVRSTRRALEQAMTLLDVIAEIRSVQPSAEFFLSNLAPREQANWTQDLHGRCTFEVPDAGPYVTLLDTGVNHGHLLLRDALSAADVHAVMPAWGGADHDGHGTEMAGLVCHGNLMDALAATGGIAIPHRLESVNIFPPQGVNPPHLYGWVLAQAVDIVETHRPQRQRVFATMTTAIGPGAGKPSEWSAAIDQMAFGLNGLVPYANGVDWSPGGLRPRLFVLSTGNVPWVGWNAYPTINQRTSVEDPGQSWNALTVGACTHFTDVDRVKWPTAVPIAQEGGLSPASTTSLLWANSWPIKPDVVAEGGNGSLDPLPHVTVGPESLRVLTTSHQQHDSPFAESGDTSAAAAEVGRICGHLRAQYPTYSESTIRALVVHGARHTPLMRAQLPLNHDKADIKNLLRTFGFGKVSLPNSLYSSEHAPTLVIQDTIVPYKAVGSAIQLNELKLHELPWPADVLRALGGTTVEMRITLSYFIEPNPSRRGWQSKFRYQSHGLRFAVKGATETEARFNQRINKVDREEAELDGDESMPDPDRTAWEVGAQLRSRGSLHSDVWTGTAAALAEKSHVAVFPVGGWWKDWSGSNRAGVPVGYSLIVSIRPVDAIAAEIDLYTPIRTAIAVANEIEIDTQP